MRWFSCGVFFFSIWLVLLVALLTIPIAIRAHGAEVSENSYQFSNVYIRSSIILTYLARPELYDSRFPHLLAHD